MKYIFAIGIILLSISSFSQDHISGKVVAENGSPLPGASVFIPNTTIGVTTDKNGVFNLSKLPVGDLKVVATFTGYHPTTVVIDESKRNKKYVLQLHENASELNSIDINLHFEKKGWDKWGDTFTAAFIGLSAYAKQCVITNKDALKFVYNDSILYAYASEPLVIQNNALGYTITAALEQFTLNVNTTDVDYQFYPLFTEMQGNDDDMLKWKKNRASVYHFSLMNFMRAVYAHNFRNEGFLIHPVSIEVNKEKERVKELYAVYSDGTKDSTGKEVENNSATAKSIKKEIGKDSLKYYQQVLLQKDNFIVVHDTLLTFEDIATRTDSNTVSLNFHNYIQVIYTKRKEPIGYFDYKKEMLKDVLTDYDRKNFPRDYPVTELTLVQGTPIEINASGYFINTDLYFNGFWGWWEKLGTRLPFQYDP